MLLLHVRFGEAAEWRQRVVLVALGAHPPVDAVRVVELGAAAVFALRLLVGAGAAALMARLPGGGTRLDLSFASAAPAFTHGLPPRVLFPVLG